MNNRFLRFIKKNYQLYLLLAPSAILLFCFAYLPMVGIVIAFQSYSPALGILGSKFVGMKNFMQYFRSYQFAVTIKNTLVLSIYSILVGFPLPILLALMCNQMKTKMFKKVFQVVTYLPHFISTMVMCGLILIFLSPSSGLFANLFKLFGAQFPNLMASAANFKHVYVWSDIWQHLGWDSIIYLAALAGIDPTYYEAATVDGATTLQKIRYIDIPMILPTAMVLLILRAGSILGIGFEKVFLLQNVQNILSSEINSQITVCSDKRGKEMIGKKKFSQDAVVNIIFHVIAILMIIGVIYPLWFVIIASFSNPADVASGKVWFWPKQFDVRGYQKLFEQRQIWKSYLNTILYTIVGTAVALLVNITAGYAMSRKDLPGRKWINVFYIIPMFVSGGLIPIYLVVKQFGLLDTFLVMVLPFAVSTYNIIVARTFFQNSLPESLWEAAQIDGCSTMRYFVQFAVPLSKAVIAVVGLWTAVGHWNSWFNALIYLQNEDLIPLQLLLRRILIANESLLGAATGTMAQELRQLSDMMKYGSIVISTLPIMMLYPFLQKYFNQGVMIGAVKG